MNTNGVEILERFHGTCKTGHTRSHLAGLGRAFNFLQQPAVEDAIRFSREQFVIRDEQEFFAFIARIPRMEPVFVPSPPPNNDPLLRYPKIDFRDRMVVVIVSHEPNCFIDLEIVGMRVVGKAMQVLCRHGEPGRVVSKPIVLGTYCAVVVNRFAGDVEFIT